MHKEIDKTRVYQHIGSLLTQLEAWQRDGALLIKKDDISSTIVVLQSAYCNFVELWKGDHTEFNKIILSAEHLLALMKAQWLKTQSVHHQDMV